MKGLEQEFTTFLSRLFRDWTGDDLTAKIIGILYIEPTLSFYNF
jgi:hypothetical protein